jgi:hypothetical protein
VVIGILFHSYHHLWKQRRTKFNIAKVSMIILGSCWPTFIILVPAKRVGIFNLLFFQKIKDFRCYPHAIHY